MIDLQGIDLFYSPTAVTSERRFERRSQCDRTVRPSVFPLHKAIERLYSDRLKKRFAGDLDSDLSQSSRVPRDEGLYNEYLSLLQCHLPPRDEINILEIGCGSGKFCQSLFEHGYRAYGVDQSRSLLQQARQTATGCKFESATPYVSFQDLFLRQFDAIVYLEAIEHLHSPRLAIQRAFESLAPGGLLIVTARYRGYLLNLTNALTGPTPSQGPQSGRDEATSTGNPTTLGRLLKVFGMEIVEFQKAGRFPQPWRSQLFVARKPTTPGGC
jgi:2-polyprenyl-3-methyl-5-hydroxy-6-metoxy-1,4-benzoquinol methylase